jgi:hypothetical protein
MQFIFADSGLAADFNCSKISGTEVSLIIHDSRSDLGHKPHSITERKLRHSLQILLSECLGASAALARLLLSLALAFGFEASNLLEVGENRSNGGLS